jgi:iron complex transport system substrate-binding protein
MIFGEKDYSRVFLSQLGFVVPPRQTAELPKLVNDPVGTQAPVSLERLDLLDADVLVLAYLGEETRTSFTGNQVFQQLPVVADGRYIDADAGLIAALRIPSVISVSYVLENLVPDVAAVLA